jgi:hypothetical protein
MKAIRLLTLLGVIVAITCLAASPTNTSFVQDQTELSSLKIEADNFDVISEVDSFIDLTAKFKYGDIVDPLSLEVDRFYPVPVFSENRNEFAGLPILGGRSPPNLILASLSLQHYIALEALT